MHWNSPSLFEQDSVIAEWEGFLEGIVSVPRPLPTERNLGLAVDASDFPRTSPWCRLVSGRRRRVKIAGSYSVDHSVTSVIKVSSDRERVHVYRATSGLLLRKTEGS